MRRKTMKRVNGEVTPQTTSQRLSSVLKSARDVMRKDKGLNGDLDRLPMITWLLFIKFLDDSEEVAEQEAELARERYHPLIDPPYRWRDWARRGCTITGPELLAFINQDEAVLPTGQRGPGLLARLRSLQSNSGAGREEVVANVFRGVVNRMESGYLLREVLEKLDDVHFDSSQEIHTLSALYESMLREMRDAAGDSGEFYTPRPVIKFMVQATAPRLGETVLDPACGTGGFLVETYQHLTPLATTVQERYVLQEKALVGQEAKSLPYMLAQMNLLLHGLEFPNIEYGNSLTTKLTEIGDRDRVDVILTNPPFGGEEEASVKNNFPANMQTSETALLFLQIIMRRLRRPNVDESTGGRAAVVVPNGVLFGDGVAARIKEQLVKNFNLHTIVRLPNGVFAPYTPIPTNLMFFDRSGPTKEIWFYALPPPAGKKNYTKMKPLEFGDFADCEAWWTERVPTAYAWRVPIEDVLRYDDDGNLLSVNLDLSNPSDVNPLEHLAPEQLVDDILVAEREIIAILEAMRAEVET
jgi:type I restriction enzyme M protein